MTNAHPSRIVSLQPSVTVILDRLNSLDLLVACTPYCQAVCAEVNDGSRLIVKDSWSSQSAEILAAQPDLVIASVPYQAASIAEILKSGTPVLALAPHSLADIYRDIAMIAGIIGRFERADAVIPAEAGPVEWYLQGGGRNPQEQTRVAWSILLSAEAKINAPDRGGRTFGGDRELLGALCKRPPGRHPPRHACRS